MTSLIFETPSRRCPYRSLNGSRVVIIGELESRRVKRNGNKITQQYLLARESDPATPLIVALADELFVTP